MRFAPSLLVLLFTMALGVPEAFAARLPAEAVKYIEEKCQARVTQRHETDGRTLAGEFYGAVAHKSPDAESYSASVGILIGISEYENYRSLPGVEQDIPAMQKLLISGDGNDLGYDAIITLTGKNVTPGNVQCLVENAGLHQHFQRGLIYWAGHGISVRDSGFLPFYDSPSESDINRSNAFPMSDFKVWATQYLKDMRQLVFVLDACLSGRSLLNTVRGGTVLPVPVEEGYEKFLEANSRIADKVAVMFTAASQDRPAAENDKGGYFTQAFIRLLRDRQPADAVDGVLDFSTLHKALAKSEGAGFSKPEYGVLAVDDTWQGDGFVLGAGDKKNKKLADFAALRDSYRQAKGSVRPDSPSAGGPGALDSKEDQIVEACTADDTAQPLSSLDGYQLAERLGRCEAAIDAGGDGPAPYLSFASYAIALGKWLAGQDAHQHYSVRYLVGAETRFGQAAEKGALQPAAKGFLDLAQLIYDKVWQAAGGGSEERMFSLAKKAYGLGDVLHGAHFLGWLYMEGLGTGKNLPQARSLFEQAWDEGRGLASAATNLGNLYWRGVDGAPDLREALKFYRFASEAGDFWGFVNTADILVNGNIPGIADREQQAVQAIEAALRMKPNDGLALSWMGWFLENGYGVSKDLEAAVRYYERSRVEGNGDSSNNLGLIKRYAKPADYAGAKDLLREACDRGTIRGCVNFADMLFSGDIEPVPTQADYSEAVTLLDRALDKQPSNVAALRLRGFALRNGLGVGRDVAMAVDFYLRAARAGAARGWLDALDVVADLEADAPEGEPAGLFKEKLDELLAAWDAAITAGSTSAVLQRTGNFVYSNRLGIDSFDLVERLLTELDRKDVPEAFDQMVDLYAQGEAYGADPAKVASVLKRLDEQDTAESEARLAWMIVSGNLTKEAFDLARLRPPWEHFAACAELGQLRCYDLAVEAVLMRPDDAEMPTQGLYVPLEAGPARDLVEKYLEAGSAAGDPASRSKLAALHLGNRDALYSFDFPADFMSDPDEAGKLLSEGVRAGDEEAEYGAVVAGLLLEKDVVPFERAKAAMRSAGAVAMCMWNGLFEDRYEARFPLSCRWGTLGLPAWSLGLAKVDRNPNLRPEPGKDNTPIRSLKAGEELICLPDMDEENAWIKVQTSRDEIGWVSRDFLLPLEESVASASDETDG